MKKFPAPKIPRGFSRAEIRPVLTLALLLFASLLSAQTENCTNGTDDDADGQIDCYDADCTCTGPCDSFFYTTCNADCYYIPPCDSISLGVQWQGTAETGTYSVLVAGDMDADGFPDILTYHVEGPEIFLLDGRTGATKWTFNGPTNYPGGTAPAMADLDRDGFGEFVLVGDDRILRCWEHDATLKWESAIQVGYHGRYRFSAPSIADFDHDGWAEILIGNQVFNGQTGALLAQGGDQVSAGEHPSRKATGFSFNQPVAVDALPDAFCPDCQGLEIVAGNQVLSVNLQTGTCTVVVSAPPGYSDGFTSIADFDRDGDLDAIVQGKKGSLNHIYVWEIETSTVMREFRLYNNWVEGASRANVADLDGDGQLEVSFVSYPWFYALKNNFTVLWAKPNDDYSAVTTSSVFDFCGDGSADVIYRGQRFLQILEGKTGNVKWQDECISATHIEAPLILDVDADGQTEVVITCGTDGTDSRGTVLAYEAINLPGIASRRVWNQHAYFNTNINDDLSVPRFQQNPHKVGNGLTLNTFLNQYFNPTFPSPDGELTLQGVVCDGDSLVVRGTVCNRGDNLLPAATPISFYKFNPQRTASAQAIGGRLLGQAVSQGDCFAFEFRIPRVANDSVFFVLNDDASRPAPFDLAQDFPVTTIGECQFMNNIAGFRYEYSPGLLSLGPDTTVCDNATVQLAAAGNDFTDWLWHDGSTAQTFLAPDAGTFAVTVSDICGITRTDEIKVEIDSSTVVRLGPDRTICQGETALLGESGFDFYAWKPSAFVNCNNCASVAAGPSQSGFVVLEAGFFNGCKSIDSVYVTVYNTFNYRVDTTICYGQTVSWNGQPIAPDTKKNFPMQTTHGCDSTVLVRVFGDKTLQYVFPVDTSVCLGRSLSYGPAMLPPDSTHVFYLSTLAGCDSTVVVKVAPRDTFWVVQPETICYGETFDVFGQSVSVSGVYQKKFFAENGCDSTHLIALTVLPQIRLEIEGTPTCLNESTGTLTVWPTGGSEPFHFDWDIPQANEATVTDLPAGNYVVTVTDAKNCTETGTGEVPGFPAIQFSVEIDSVRCYGEASGQIRIEAADPTLIFSLDGTTWIQKTEFSGLAADDYTLSVQDVHGCIETRAAPVFQPDELFIQLPGDTTLRLGDSLRLAVQSNATTPLSLRWSDRKYFTCDTCPGDIVSKPWHSIRYAVRATDAQGCTASDDILVIVERIIGVFVPNAFSPEVAENEANARLQPGFGQAIERLKSLRIFDRWGTVVHDVSDLSPGDLGAAWEGRHHGKAAPPGVYVWMLEVQLTDGTVEKFRGDVAVVR